jgi:hypothetical protein
VMGHAMPMEVVLRVRSFDQAFYSSLQSANTSVSKGIGENLVKSEKGKVSLEDLFGE